MKKGSHMSEEQKNKLRRPKSEEHKNKMSSDIAGDGNHTTDR